MILGINAEASKRINLDAFTNPILYRFVTALLRLQRSRTSPPRTPTGIILQGCQLSFDFDNPIKILDNDYDSDETEIITRRQEPVERIIKTNDFKNLFQIVAREIVCL